MTTNVSTLPGPTGDLHMQSSNTYRALVATAPRFPHLHASGPPGNIDIHIHAILTPLRTQMNTVSTTETLDPTHPPGYQPAHSSSSLLPQADESDRHLSSSPNMPAHGTVEDTNDENGSSQEVNSDAILLADTPSTDTRDDRSEMGTSYYASAMSYLATVACWLRREHSSLLPWSC